ncbi:MAG TPA: alpha/beta fold hydrolase, partial [bacterium]|nr:alpha/beta fold hydrolase [bacterium]
MPSSAQLKKVAQTVQLLILILAIPASAQDLSGQGFFTTSDHVKLHYLEAGQGEAILFIPGWLMPADIWEPQFQELSKDYHVVVLDPRSQGQSDMTPLGNDPLRRSTDIRELLDHLHLDSVVLVGWALGAFDTLAYLRQYGNDKLNGLVLVDSPLAAASAPSTQRSPFLMEFQTDRENANRNYVWGLFKQQAHAGFYKKLIQSAALVPTQIALSALDNTIPGENWDPGLKALRQVPLLYAITPKFATQAAYLQQVDPQARVENFDHSGHALFVDEPEHFNAVIRDFLHQSSLYPAGLPSARSHAAPPSTASTPIPSTSAPLAVSTPLPPAPPSPTPIPPTTSPTPTDSATPTATNTIAPQINVNAAASPTPNLLATSTGTPLPTMAPNPPTAPASSESPANPPTAVPTASTSFTERLAQTWASFMHQQATPTPNAQPSPIPPKRHPAPNVSTGNSIQDGFFVTSDKVRLHYLEAGQGQAIVFISGWLLPAEIWKAQLEDLSQDFHVIALDTRSQGESDITPQGDEPLRQAQDIQELLDYLQLTSVVLVGWSHGGFQVLAYMGEFGTDRLYAAVLVDSALGAASSNASSASQSRFLDQFKTDRPKAVRSFVWGLFKNPPPGDFLKELDAEAVKPPTDIALALMNNAFPGDRWQPSLKIMNQVPLLYAVTPKYTFQANYL